MADRLTIGELAQRAGVRPSALRYYERERLLPAPERVGGQRRYRLTAVRQVMLVRMAREAGLSIAEARELLDGFPDDASPSRRWQEVGRAQLPRIAQRIRELQALHEAIEHCLGCGCMHPRSCGLLGDDDGSSPPQ